MTAGTWNLLMLVVHPARQREDRGAALVRAAGGAVRSRGGRLLLVETSGTEGFTRQRVFYRRLGYEEEARLRDFYDAGDDKVVSSKPLAGPCPEPAQAPVRPPRLPDAGRLVELTRAS